MSLIKLIAAKKSLAQSKLQIHQPPVTYPIPLSSFSGFCVDAACKENPFCR